MPNELHESLLRTVSFTPRSLQFPNAWVGHLPFAAWLMREWTPGTFVELGTHSGNSFFTFCQSVADAGLPTRCFAVDTWQGDEHANQYGEEVFAEVSRYHQAHYAAFARLLRMRFDEALDYFPDESVDLLHIDGLHTYEAVRYDFESWMPKLAPGAVVLFHDTNVRERNFGVWKLWRELEHAYPRHLEFVHSHGLGVLQLNNAPADRHLAWLVPGSAEQQAVAAFFAAMSDWQLRRYDLQECRQELSRVSELAGASAAQVAALTELVAHKDQHLGHMHNGVVQRDQQIAARDARLAELDAELAACRAEAAELNAIRRSRSWRALAPIRSVSDTLRRIRRRATVPPVASPPVDPALAALVDASWYLDTNPDVKQAQASPLEHFMACGWRELRNPHPLFDVRWYLDTYPDVRDAHVNPLAHYLACGWREGRQPHPLFDSRWYLDTNHDVRDAGVNPLLHYIVSGAAELRSPHPTFDARYYAAAHPDAAANPLRYHVTIGHAAGFPTRAPETGGQPVQAPAVDIADCLPRPSIQVTDIAAPVDIVVPVYRGYLETRRCLDSLLADRQHRTGALRVIDDCSPERELSAWLDGLAADGLITLTRHEQNRGFVVSVNEGMADAGRRDVLLLNSDTEVPRAFLPRLAAHAGYGPRVATVTPFSNAAGEMCSYPSECGGPLPAGYSLEMLDAACQTANGSRSVEVPVGRGFCLYIRRECLDAIGPFDEQAFGRGYGEESDFCLRAGKAGWRHVLACDTFVFHAGQVSFGPIAPERDQSWHTLVQRHPDLPEQLRRHRTLAPARPRAFAATAALFRASNRPVVLTIGHAFGHEPGPLTDLLSEEAGTARLMLTATSAGFELSVPSLPGHPRMPLPANGLANVVVYARACGVQRVEVKHWLGLDGTLRSFLRDVELPVDVTVHDYALA